MPALFVRVLSERAEVFFPDNCQVGLAVILIINAISFYSVKKPMTSSALGLRLGSTIKMIYMRNLSQFSSGAVENFIPSFLRYREERHSMMSGRLYYIE